MLGARKQDTESSASQFTIDEFDIAAGEYGAAPRDGKTEPHPSGLKRDGRLEQRVTNAGVETGARVVHFDGDTPIHGVCYTEHDASGLGGLSRVFEQVRQHSFDQIFVRDG